MEVELLFLFLRLNQEVSIYRVVLVVRNCISVWAVHCVMFIYLLVTLYKTFGRKQPLRDPKEVQLIEKQTSMEFTGRKKEMLPDRCV